MATLEVVYGKAWGECCPGVLERIKRIEDAVLPRVDFPEAASASPDPDAVGPLLAVCSALDKVQRTYEENARRRNMREDECLMPGNGYYSEQLMSIVHQARALLAVHGKRTGEG